MTTTVYYWAPHGNQVGHVAVGVRGNFGQAYISWWPKDEGKMDTSGKLMSVIIGVPGIGYTLAQDIAGEDNRQPIMTTLEGLNEAAIIAWWRTFKFTDWSLLRVSCAQVAVEALRAGAAGDHVSTVSGWLSGWQATYWKPMEVHIYAQHVRSGLAGAPP